MRIVGPARLVHPRAAPRGEIGGRARVEPPNEIRPVALPNAVRLEILAQAVAKRVRADQQLELAHDDRRLLIDDRAVERAGLVEVREILPDRVGAVRAVDVVGGRIVLQEEPQLVVHRRERRVDDLRRHEIGEHLLHPDVVEPRIVTRSPNHMCAVSCAMTLARPSDWFCVAVSSSSRPFAL